MTTQGEKGGMRGDLGKVFSITHREKFLHLAPHPALPALPALPPL